MKPCEYIKNKAKTKIQPKNDANMKTMQPIKQNNIVANKNNYKASQNRQHFYDEDRNKQIYSHIKIHLKNIT